MLPLDGVRILDLTTVLPGRYCTMLLGEMGAEVVKIVEVKPRWDPIQLFLPKASPEKKELDEELIRTVNCGDRNKKSLALNLKDKNGKEIFYRLIKTAGVVIEGFRPGVVQRLGIDYKRVKEINPSIIYCSISGYGQYGPYKDLPGHDPNYQAFAGITYSNLFPDGKPMFNGFPVGDLSGGMQAVIGILLALIARDKTGKGQFIDISITDVLVSWFSVSPIGRSYFISGRKPKPGEGLYHFMLKTKDGRYIYVSPIEPQFWEKLCQVLAIEEYIPYHRDILIYNPAGGGKREEIILLLQNKFETKTRDEWFQILKKADICVSPVYEIDEVFEDPHVRERMVHEIDHPMLGKVKQPGIPVKLSETPGQIRGPAPLLGEHTEEILLSLGYDKTLIENLEKRGIIFSRYKRALALER